MIDGATAGGLLGGLGLFLLGMAMLTDGLRLAAGAALERILAGATRTRWHALGSGMLVTALVQSSSTVTVALIGFINAGLLGLGPALWVLFGANVGTTMTGWIVAGVGLKFKIEALALPLIGIGALLRLGGQGRRRGAVGFALAGLGLLFLGIAMLQSAFVALASQATLPQGDGLWVLLAQLGSGALMTVLMQSSSASMAVALTAAQGGLLPAEGAAAVVIGANIGTTVSAALAALGATPNARRAAAAHVIFNLLTGAVALILLPVLVRVLDAAGRWIGLPPEPALALALFHSAFNLLGVALMWPMAAPLTRWLQARFRAREEDLAQPRYLDDNSLAVPTLALSALEREVARIGELAARLLQAVLGDAPAAERRLLHGAVVQLQGAAQRFVERMNRGAMSQATSERLALVLRVLRYHESSAEEAMAAAPLPRLADPAVRSAAAQLLEPLQSLVAMNAPLATPAADEIEALRQALELAYEQLKSALLADGAAGRLPLAEMEAALRRYSALRRAAQQAIKALQRHPGSGMPRA